MGTQVDEITKLILDEVRELRKDVGKLSIKVATIETKAKISGAFMGTLFSGIVGTLFFFIRK